MDDYTVKVLLVEISLLIGYIAGRFSKYVFLLFCSMDSFKKFFRDICKKRRYTILELLPKIEDFLEK